MWRIVDTWVGQVVGPKGSGGVSLQESTPNGMARLFALWAPGCRQFWEENEQSHLGRMLHIKGDLSHMMKIF